IIEMLLDRYPRVAGREDLLETIWDEFAFVDDNTLNVNVTRVRKQLQELGIQDAIETVRGVGYRLHVTCYGVNSIEVIYEKPFTVIVCSSVSVWFNYSFFLACWIS